MWTPKEQLAQERATWDELVQIVEDELTDGLDHQVRKRGKLTYQRGETNIDLRGLASRVINELVTGDGPLAHFR
jgi:hypothetical protein